MDSVVAILSKQVLVYTMLSVEQQISFLRQDLLGPSNPLKLLSTADPPPDTDSDLLLAQMLQLEFDREHDHMLNAEEKHYNKHNRGEWDDRALCGSMPVGWILTGHRE